VINGIRIAILKKCIPNDLISINFFNINEKSKSPEIQHLTIDENAGLSDWPYGFFDQEERDLADIFEGRKQ
jgi:predicted ATPase